MPQVVNLDEVLVERTEIRKTVPGEQVPRVWHLRDDIPAEVMLRVFRLMKSARDSGAAAKSAVDELSAKDGSAIEDEMVDAITAMEERLKEHVQETLEITLDIWRHSYPATTEDELRDWFTHEERERLVQLFFSRRLMGSLSPSSGTTGTTTMSKTQQKAQRRRSSGATPSQKRLSRQLNGAM